MTEETAAVLPVALIALIAFVTALVFALCLVLDARGKL